jgi:hypothetical protein
MVLLNVFAHMKKTLANPEPSTHALCVVADHNKTVAIGVGPDAAPAPAIRRP